MTDRPEIVTIYSENNDYQYVETLKRKRNKRTKSKQFFAEGKEIIESLIENGWPIDVFLYSKEKRLSEWAENILDKSEAYEHWEMPNELMHQLSDIEKTSEIMAIVDMPDDDLFEIEIKKDLFVVVLDRPTTPEEVGEIIRSCDCDAIIMTGHEVDLYDPKTIQASKGAIFSIPVIRLDSQKELIPWADEVKKELEGFEVVGSEKFEKMKNSMLIIGTNGLSHLYKKLCDKIIE